LLTAPELTALVAPWRLAVVWTVMVLAMTPMLLVIPVRHVWDRTFANQRGLMATGFLAGYLGAWTLAGAPLISLMLLIRREGLAAYILAAVASVLWQVSPLKQACLNRCHRRSTIPGFGLRSLVSAVGYGLGQGARCVGACWHLMLAPLVLPAFQFESMVAASVFTAAERTAPPARPNWSFHSTAFALRKAAAALRGVERGIRRWIFGAWSKRHHSWHLRPLQP
jgi:predicted metal-binding membrane protein